ncbi:MAG TPA: WD40 repeat domain-containing protein, partial [Gemmataceae bacterium]|nr:WD40 repeat domain-containing protein [Gemmataceae bacterium]
MRRLIAVLSILLPAAPVAAQSPDMYEGTIRGFLKRLGSDRFRQAHRVAAITYSPDGKHLATADGESIHIWDASDGRRVRTIPFADHEVLSIRHTSDSKSLLVVGYYDDSGLVATPPGRRPQTWLCKYDAATAKFLYGVAVLPGRSGAVVFSPGDDWVAVRDENGRKLVVIDIRAPKVAWSDQLGEEKFHSLAFRGDSTAVAVGTLSGRLRLYDPKSGKLLHECAVEGGAIWNMAFSPDGKDIVAEISSPGPNHVARLDAESGKVRWKFDTERAKELRFTSDGQSILYQGQAGGRLDPEIWRWLDAATGKPLDRTMDADYGHTVTIRPDGKVLAVGGFHGHISQWDLRTRKRLDDSSADPAAPVTGLQFSPDGKILRGRSQEHWYEWDVKTGKQTRVPARGQEQGLVGPEGGTATVTAAGEHLTFVRWNRATGPRGVKFSGRLPDPDLMKNSFDWNAALSPDGGVLAVTFVHAAFRDQEELHTALFDARNGRYLSGWWDLHSRGDLAFSPDDRSVACFHNSILGIDIREVASGARRLRYPIGRPISACRYSPDARVLAIGTTPGPVELWDATGDRHRPVGKWESQKPDTLWEALADFDAEHAFDVIRLLRANPTEAVAFLKERVKSPKAVAADWVGARVKALDAPAYRDREKATAQLADAGETVADSLRDALK